MPFEVTEKSVSTLEPFCKSGEDSIVHRLPDPEFGKSDIIAPGGVSVRGLP